MAILETDIKLLESQRLDDSDEGGGRATGNVVVDGAENNLFPDLSDDDLVAGRVNLRKIFAGAVTNNVDVYFAVKLLVMLPPVEPLVNIALFTTDDPADKRPGAQDYVERYLAEGPNTEMKLLGTHFVGQQLLFAFQRLGAYVPEIGDVIVMSEEDGGGNVIGSQFVRVQAVEAEVAEYSDGQGVYTKQNLLITIQSSLTRQFPGGVPTRNSDYQPDTRIRRATAIDSARYYGTKKLTVATNLNDLQINIGNPYQALVPATQGETPVLDVQAGGVGLQEIVSGGETFEITGPVHTGKIDIDINNRGLNYVFTCRPLPAAGTLVISFRALGRWYTITESGDGSLAGDGAGQLNLITGSLAVTLAALPDVPSALLFAWSSKVHYTDRAGTANYDPVTTYWRLGNAVDPGSFVLSWTGTDDNPKTATAAAGTGVISGDVTGQLVHHTGEFYIVFATLANLPKSGTNITADYNELTRRQEKLTGTVNGQVIDLTLSNVPIEPGTVVLRVPYMSANQGRFFNSYWSGPTDPPYYGLEPYLQTLTDDGAGGFNEDATATINYATGDVTFSRYRDEDRDVFEDHAWLNKNATGEYNGTTIATYQETLLSPAAKQEIITTPPLSVRFLPAIKDFIVPGTLRFKIGNQVFNDGAGMGIIYKTADGSVAGSINYLNRVATLTDHNIQGQPNTTIVINSLITSFGEWTDYEFRFRTPGSPLQPGSFIITATAEDGTLIDGTTDVNGNITGTLIEGTIDQTNGIVTVRFGELVADSSLTTEEKSEWWYDPADIDGSGNIWKPTFVYPNTVKFNVVVLTFIPLDPTLLGLDPVRLPLDGRVPIFRVGYFLVIHHTDTVADPAPSAGAVVALGRPRVTWVRVEDTNGVKVDPAQYVTDDLVNGNFQWANPLDLAGYTGPYTIYHTIADMALATDVRIDGVITLNQAISYVFPADDSFVSSALRFGDQWAQYENLFSQQTWTGAWSDERIGNDTTGQYNDVLYPIAVTNDGAITERWRIEFTSSTAFNVVGETVGQIAIGDINTELSPTNPNSGQPYFVLQEEGWGAGWVVGNVVRFNTIGAQPPAWIIRTITQGAAAVQSDEFHLQVLGNKDV